MIDFTMTQVRRFIIAQFESKYPMSIPLKILIVTYNRLPYLKKCIASIHGATAVPFEIMVADDGSTDGTVDWLLSQRKRRKINKLIFNNRVGTAANFNQGIEAYDSEWVVIANDDMYFHRWWDFASLYVSNAELDAATVTIYDYTNNKGILERKGEYDCITGSGLSAAFIRCESWATANKFNLPPKRKMGFFAFKFCAQVNKCSKFKRHLITRPNWVHNMDLVSSKLSERDILKTYIDYRLKEKKGVTG